MEGGIRREVAARQSLVDDQSLQEGQKRAVDREVAAAIRRLEFHPATLGLETGRFCQRWVALDEIGGIGKEDHRCRPGPGAPERAVGLPSPQATFEEW